MEEVNLLKNKEKNAIIKQSRTQFIPIIGGLVLLAILILFGTKVYRQKKKDN